MSGIARRFFVYTIAASIVLSAGAAFCADMKMDVATTDTAAKGVELLGEIEGRYKETKTFFGEFDQVKTSSLFLEEIKSKGRFWYEKPGLFRCEYLPPNAQVNLIANETAYVYIPDIKQVEIYRFKPEDSPVKKMNRMLLGFGASTKDVLEVYEVRWIPEEEKPDIFAILFKPKTKDEDFNFEAIRIWFRKDTLLPTRLVFEESGGDKTQIDLSSVEFNKKIKESVFKPDFPKDADVIEQN